MSSEENYRLFPIKIADPVSVFFSNQCLIHECCDYNYNVILKFSYQILIIEILEDLAVRMARIASDKLPYMIVIAIAYCGY
jgi:hypothetical protein